MVGEQNDLLKEKYTDKYVVVDAQRPELARFRDVVGQVKTVNMSGRALVEFLDYHINIGWYDIDPSFLKVVDKPIPKPKEAPAKVERSKMSVADMLAAARAGGATGSAPAAKPQAAEETAKAAPAIEKAP